LISLHWHIVGPNGRGKIHPISRACLVLNAHRGQIKSIDQDITHQPATTTAKQVSEKRTNNPEAFFSYYSVVENWFFFWRPFILHQ